MTPSPCPPQDAVAIQMEEARLVKIKEVLKELPAPHYRYWGGPSPPSLCPQTLLPALRCPHTPQDPGVPDEAPPAHGILQQPDQHARQEPRHRLGPQPAAVSWGGRGNGPGFVGGCGAVWGGAGQGAGPRPRGRSKDIEATGFNGTAAFMEVRVQSIVVEFILTHVEQLFGDAPLCGTSPRGWGGECGDGETGGCPDTPPPSPGAAGGEAARRSRLLPGDGQAPYHVPAVLSQGDGPPPIRPYHTIIELGEHR